MSKWLSRGVSPAIQAMCRGSLPAAEQQELVRQLCASVAQQLPEYALIDMVLELLKVDLQAGGCCVLLCTRVQMRAQARTAMPGQKCMAAPW